MQQEKRKKGKKMVDFGFYPSAWSTGWAATTICVKRV